MADVLLPLVGTKTLLPSYAASLFDSNPPDKALAALVCPPVECDVVVSSATKKAIAQPGSCVPTMSHCVYNVSDLLHRYRHMIEQARAFQSALLCDVSGDSGSLAEGVAGEQAVAVQFELAAGCYATSFLFEMCAGDAK